MSDTTPSRTNGLRNSLLTRRLARKWSQAELAERTGISRAAVSAIEGERLSPSVATALSLASVLECSVEELFGRANSSVAKGPEWAWSPRLQTNRYWEAEVHRRRLLYPVEAVSLNSIPHDGVWQDGIGRESCPPPAERPLTVASCDPAVGLLAAEYARASGFRMLVFPRGGSAAVQLVRQRLVHVAALHRSTEEHPERNADFVRAELGDGYRLLRVAQWQAGIALPTEDLTHSPDVVVSHSPRWAMREPGSAARDCLDELLGGRDCPGRQVDGHFSVAEAVRLGWAEAGVCVKLCAVEAGLNFLPLRTEALDFCFPVSLQNDPRIQALVGLLRNRAFRRLVSDLPGYDGRQTGELAFA